jgi:hypothetical protein
VIAVSGVVVERCPAQILGGTQLTEEAEPDTILLPDAKISYALTDDSQADFNGYKNIDK